jgi:hypothetical protein
MLSGLDRAQARRMWFVPEFEIWGLAEWGTADFLVVEQIGAESTIGYGSHSLGGDAQAVVFEDLIDHRGNHLPSTIDAARVIIRPRSTETAFVVGSESATGFKLARDPDAAGPVAADLLILELGA